MATDKYGSGKAADNYRLESSKLLVSPDDATYNLIMIPKFALVTDVWVQIVTAFTVNASIEVGWSGNGQTAVTDGFITSEVSDPLNVGLKRAFNTTASTFPGKWFLTAAGIITATVLDNGGAVGSFRIVAQFSILHP
jgi:hypothetical protein